jgi:hypothetical protein
VAGGRSPPPLARSTPPATSPIVTTAATTRLPTAHLCLICSALFRSADVMVFDGPGAAGVPGG